MKHVALLLLVVTAFCQTQARDVFVLPEGAGNKDGSAWEQAFGQEALTDWNKLALQPGDRLLIGSGEYPNAALKITAGGKTDAPVMIEGVDRGGGLPIFTSDWQISSPAKGRTAIEFAADVDEVAVRHLRIRGYAFGVLAGPTKGKPPRQRLAFEDVDMDHLRHGFYLSDCKGLNVVDCELTHYSKHGFRFEQGCSDVRMEHCSADCSGGDAAWEKQTELFLFGYLINDTGTPNRGFIFEDCLAANNLMPLQTTKYPNGDGFVVEETASDIQFVRCRSLRNQDGGFDLKVKDVKLTDCVSLGNSRNFRIWTTATLTNCFSGRAKTGLWCNGGPVTIQHSTFYAIAGSAIQTDDSAKEPVTLTDCLLSAVQEVHTATGPGAVKIDSSNALDQSPDGASAKFVRNSPDWKGQGDAMDSQGFPNKGYRGPKVKD